MSTSIALTAHFESFSQRLVSGGRSNNVSEVVRDVLRMLEARMMEESAKLQALRRAIRVGRHDVEEGNLTPLRNPAQIEEFVKHAGQRASERAKKV